MTAPYYGGLFPWRGEKVGTTTGGGIVSQAAVLYPAAVRPPCGSALARRAGIEAALEEIQRVFELRPADAERQDPWWTYHMAQARNADQLLDDLRRPFLETAQ